MSRSRKHAGRPGRSKWKTVFGRCVRCAKTHWLDKSHACKTCRRAT